MVSFGLYTQVVKTNFARMLLYSFSLFSLYDRMVYFRYGDRRIIKCTYISLVTRVHYYIEYGFIMVTSTLLLHISFLGWLIIRIR
jgi:hypothetical protein